MFATLLTAALFAAVPAHAQDDVGIPVTLRVVDDQGAPIPHAKVRHPEEKMLHPVNTATGEWTESVLYMDDGSQYVFDKGMELTLEVSAAGFVTRTVRYEVRRRRNLLPVRLETFVDTEPPPEPPIIGFGRDVPRD